MLSKIIEGWRNHLFPKEELKEIILKVSEQRIEICSQCENNSKFHNSIRPDEHCTLCGCSLAPKTKCLSCKCPIDKWLNIISEEEELNIKEDE